MNKIKTVKIKNEDGSVSIESYNISADARNVDMTNGYNVQDTIGTIDVNNDGSIAEQLNNINNGINDIEIDIKKKTYYFNTIADMKKANLQEGDFVITLGYYEPNDGGAGEYKIVSGTYTDDGGSYHQLDNNLYAELIIKNNRINIKQFGAKADNNTDTSNAFIVAINNGYNILIDKGTYKITNTLNIDKQLIIEGCGNATIIKYTGENFLFNISTNLANKPIIRNMVLSGTSSNSLLKCARNGFGSSFVIENCTITRFNNKIFELTSTFDPIIRNLRIISAGKILFNTYDGAYGENSFSNNVVFEHVYYTGDPNPAPLVFDLNNVRYLHLIGCQFEKITKLIDAKNNTKYVILDHSWVEQTENFYSKDLSSSNIEAINTNIVLTTNYNEDYVNIDYLVGNDKKVINIKGTGTDTYRVLKNSDNWVIDHITTYNANNTNYPYQTVYSIGSNDTIFNMPMNITKQEGTDVSTLSYQVKNICKYSNVPIVFDFLIDVMYPDFSERFYEFKYIQKSNTGYRLCTINKIYENIWQNSDTSKYTEEITQNSSGNVTITSTGTMKTCTITIKHNFIK